MYDLTWQCNFWLLAHWSDHTCWSNQTEKVKVCSTQRRTNINMLTKSFETNELLSYSTIHGLLILEKAKSISEIEDVFVDMIVTNSSESLGWSVLLIS